MDTESYSRNFGIYTWDIDTEREITRRGYMTRVSSSPGSKNTSTLREKSRTKQMVSVPVHNRYQQIESSNIRKIRSSASTRGTKCEEKTKMKGEQWTEKEKSIEGKAELKMTENKEQGHYMFTVTIHERNRFG